MSDVEFILRLGGSRRVTLRGQIGWGAGKLVCTDPRCPVHGEPVHGEPDPFESPLDFCPTRDRGRPLFDIEGAEENGVALSSEGIRSIVEEIGAGRLVELAHEEWCEAK
jgi:hypothetical protein